MLTSKWIIHRIGLVDFWYYDEEEFYFKDGRLLLRGANGSGKSVTMQSFIPLLLDGNKASERLDPFGTKARRLENYLLEEGDGREERTGYLYMEFKRKESDTYTTIGIGLNAKRGKKLDSWYFCIHDGRRIGKDFFLYKDMKEKIPLSRLELTNRIAQGGQVVSGQREYMKLVNDTLFGYETVEEYKELIDLLIQLRTPKLSKDFKPTVLNEILSNSLPPLSDEDLRPMSEAIENMDHLKARMESLEQSMKAADRILEVYQQYNHTVLAMKANWYLRALEQDQNISKEKAQLEEQIVDSQKQYSDELQREQALRFEQKSVEEKRDNLADSDISRLAEKKVALETQQAGYQQDIAEKKKQLTHQEEREKELERSIQLAKEKEEEDKDQVETLLREMEQCFEILSFDENEFLCEELRNAMSEEYSFESIKQLTRQKKQQLEDGIQCLQKYQLLKEEYEKIQVALEKLNQELKNLIITMEQYEEQVRQVQDEWQEHFYQWIRENEWLVIPEVTQQQMVQYVLNFSGNSDLTAMKEALRLIMEEKQKEFLASEALSEHERGLLAEKLKERKLELEEWEKKEDPEPERCEEVKANRDWLKEQKIPYYSLYQVVDFVETMSQTQRDHLEEALYHMGILDAIIVPSNYQEQVVAMRDGMCDRYLFAEARYVKESMEKFLEVSAETDDIIFYSELTRLLSGFSVVADGSTWIDENGIYGIGQLRGTITGTYQAKYIGVRARQEYRKERVAELTKLVEQAQEALSSKEEEIKRIRNQKQQLQIEYHKFPDLDDLRIAVKSLEEIKNDILFQQKKIDVKEEERVSCYEQVKTYGIQAAEYSRKLYLKAELSIFECAKKEMGEYQEMVFQLENLHQRYLHQIQTTTSVQDRYEECEEIIDGIRYDLGSNERKLSLILKDLKNIEEQLQLSGYEQIQTELLACARRLEAIPMELKDCYSKQSAAQKDLENYQKELYQLEEKAVKAKKELEYTMVGFLAERDLGYVEDVESMEHESVESSAKKLFKQYYIKDGKTVLEISTNFQEKFFSNTSELADFHVSQKRIFQTMEEEDNAFGYNFQRIDVTAKYKGKEVPFITLCKGLKEDMEVQRQLVKESDRTLFQDILANTISKKIRYKIYNSEKWVERMNELMSSMNTSSGLKLSLVWKKKKAEEENQLNTKELVELLKKDAGLMAEEELEQLSKHFQSKVEEARRMLMELGNSKSFHAIMREVLDYRKWFEFQLYFEKTGERRKELTNNAFFTFSGGEKAMSMYVPLFSAVVAKYQGAREDAPRLVSLDEAFAGVDEQNIRDMFRLMVELEFEFIINSQILWGDCDTVPSLSIYQLLRKENAKYVTVLPYIWNGNKRILITDEKMMES